MEKELDKNKIIFDDMVKELFKIDKQKSNYFAEHYEEYKSFICTKFAKNEPFGL